MVLIISASLNYINCNCLTYVRTVKRGAIHYQFNKVLSNLVSLGKVTSLCLSLHWKFVNDDVALRIFMLISSLTCLKKHLSVIINSITRTQIAIPPFE